MSGDCLGRIFRLTTFGESHGPGLGGIIEGCPPGISLSEEDIQRELDARRPGQGGASTSRREKDRVRVLSGIFEGWTTGTSIGFYVLNEEKKSSDYSHLRDVYRPGHGDFTYQAKYGIRDHRGGGRSSGRETVSRVAGGAVARALLRKAGVEVGACTTEMGGIPAEGFSLQGAPDRPYFAASDEVVPAWEKRVREVREQGDSLGGIVHVRATGVPPGWGEPVMDKLDARLAYALMGVGAVKGVEVGAGFESSRSLGSRNNDFMTREGFLSNNAGGVLAGISSGQDIDLRVGVKPIPSVAQKQQTVDAKGSEKRINVGGRHDICAIPRIVPVLQSMVLLTLADMYMLQTSRVPLESQ